MLDTNIKDKCDSNGFMYFFNINNSDLDGLKFVTANWNRLTFLKNLE